jgi:hypothetical protein
MGKFFVELTDEQEAQARQKAVREHKTLEQWTADLVRAQLPPPPPPLSAPTVVISPVFNNAPVASVVSSNGAVGEASSSRWKNPWVVGIGLLLISAGGTWAWTSLSPQKTDSKKAIAEQVTAALPESPKLKKFDVTVDGDTTKISITAVADGKGGLANVVLYFASAGAHWQKGEDSVVVVDHQAVPLDQFASKLTTTLGNQIKSAGDIVAIGVASQDGVQTDESDRAGSRARRLAQVIAAIPTLDANVYWYNLGQYKGVCAACGDAMLVRQRPVLVAVVTNRSAGSSVEEIIGNALSDPANFPGTLSGDAPLPLKQNYNGAGFGAVRAK